MRHSFFANSEHTSVVGKQPGNVLPSPLESFAKSCGAPILYDRTKWPEVACLYLHRLYLQTVTDCHGLQIQPDLFMFKSEHFVLVCSILVARCYIPDPNIS